MHKHFKEVISEMAAHQNIEQDELLKSLESTIEHAARKHLHLHRDEKVEASVDPQTGALKVTRAGEEVPMSDLGTIHLIDKNLDE